MPGAGKSTVGVVLAKTAALEFVDTDLLIQKQTGRKLQEIIEENERKSLEEQADEHTKKEKAIDDAKPTV